MDEDDSVHSDDMFQMSSMAFGADSARVRLLSFSDDEQQNSILQEENQLDLRFEHINSTFVKSQEEKKFKRAIVSVLIVGITLIIILNIGLGIKLRNNKLDYSPFKGKVCNSDEGKADHGKHCANSFPWQSFRLPTCVLPRHYFLSLHPNLTLKHFSGIVDIVINVKETTDTIVLHSKNLTLKEVKLYQDYTPLAGNNKNTATLQQRNKFLTCTELDLVAIQLSTKIVPGKNYTIHMEFSGNLTAKLSGFYLSNYRSKSGENKTLAATQFESISARAAFPCFDEPVYKANFTLTIVHDPDHVAVSNMPISKSIDFGERLVKDVFETSVAMSTYLVAFIVSDFSNVSNTVGLKNGNVKVSVYAPREKINNADFALHMACEVLKVYEQVFKVAYPLPKLDLFAIPDFQAGAMENWGLVTYRETLILFDNETSSVTDQERVALVIAHELAHQWFGNLVTMTWWNDLWLNEGFASYVEYFGTDKVMPDWNIMQEFSNEHTNLAMSTDESKFTHPISVTVNDSVQIDEVFDDISYSKGACLISMLISYLGNELFFDGIEEYLKMYAYNNTVNMDLIRAVANKAKEPGKRENIQNMMISWTTLPGFPVISASITDKQVTISQDRYMISGPDEGVAQCSLEEGKQDTVWLIPISYTTNISPYEPMWLFLDKRETTFKIPGNLTWIKFNFKRQGYYIVNYDDDMLTQLSNQMKKNHSVFLPSDRSGILFDIGKAAKAGFLDYERVLNVLTYIEKEMEYQPIYTACLIIQSMEKNLRMQLDEDSKLKIQKFLIKLLSNMYDESGWPTIVQEKKLGHSEKKLGKLVTSTLCSCNYGKCTDEALKRFQLWRRNNTAVSLDYKNIVYSAGIRLGSAEDWDFMWKKYSKDLSIDALERKKLLKALCQTTDERKIMFLLDESMKGESIRHQDAAHVFVHLTFSRVGSFMAWKFFCENWKQVVKIYSMGSFSVRYIVQSLVGTFTDDYELAGAKEFFQSNNMTHIRFVKHALDKARINIHWVKVYQPKVVQWLRKNVDSDHG